MSYAQFDASELEAIEEMAAHGFTPDDIAEVIPKRNECGNLTIASLYNNDHEAYKAYRKGFLQSELALRQRIFIDAKNGSSPAQMLAKKIMDEAAYKMSGV